MLVATIPAIFHIRGDASIKKRPLQPILSALNELCVEYDIPCSDAKSYAKNEHVIHQSYDIITINGKKIEEELNIHLEGKFSQVVSGLLIASSFLDSKFHISLDIAGEAPYIMMTLSHLKKRGAIIHTNDTLTKYECHGRISFKSKYMQSFCETVPNDWSQACFLALASISSSSPLSISPLLIEKEQADSSVVSYIERLGGSIHFEDSTLNIGTKNKLKANHFNLSNTPDSLPYLASLCSIAEGKSILEDIEICRFKECDRVHAISVELAKLGVNVIEENNKLIIEGKTQLKSGARLCTYQDHRIAMSLISLCLSLEKEEWCIIEGVECCKISYPAFLQTLLDLGARIEKIDT